MPSENKKQTKKGKNIKQTNPNIKNTTKSKKDSTKKAPTKKTVSKAAKQEKKEVSKKKVPAKKGTIKQTTKKVPKFSTISNIKVEEKKSPVKTKEQTKKKQQPKKEIKVKEKKQKQKKENKFFPFWKKKKQEKKQQQKSKKQPQKGKTKTDLKKNTEPLFTAKTKKMLTIFAVICIAILCLEGIYFIAYKIEKDAKNIYYDSLNSLVLDNQNIVAVGSSNFKYSKENDYTGGYEKAKLIKYDKDGTIIFEKMYEKGIHTTFSSILSIPDGYIVVGYGQFSEEEVTDEVREAFIIKYSKEGEIIWEKFYTVLTDTKFNKVIATQDGGYIAIGQSIYANMELGNHTTGGGIIVKYDQEGNEIWHNNHGGVKSGNFNGIVEVNGNYYVVGKDATDSANLVKYDANGNYQWHKNFSFTDSLGFSGIAYLNNALYVVGSKKILPEGTTMEDKRDTDNTDAILLKYDLDGNIQFEKTFGGSNFERYNSIYAYQNKLYVVGHTTSEDAGLKTDTDGKLMTGIIVQYDQNGNMEKKDSLGGSHDDNLTQIYTDGVSIYITAYSNSKDGNIAISKDNGKDFFGKVIKLDMKFRTLMVR